MSKDREDKFNHKPDPKDEFSLESILAEFGGGVPEEHRETPSVPYTPQEAAEEIQERREEAFFFPPKPKEPPKAGKITAFPGTAPPPKEEPEEPDEPAPESGSIPSSPEPPSRGEGPKVLEFPTPPPENPVAAGIDQLRRKADRFADHMFEEEGAEKAQAVRRAEKLIPGVDEERTAPPSPRPPKPRRRTPPPPDRSPAELLKKYNKGFRFYRIRTALVCFLTLPLLYLTLWEALPPLPAALARFPPADLKCYLMAALQGLAILLGADVLGRGIAAPFRGRPDMDTLCALSNLFVLADALTLPTLWPGETPRLPFCAVATLSLALTMWGEGQKRRGQRLACRTAAAAAQPYRVTRDEGKWNSRDTYAKWSGTPSGFGSQLQEPDGAQRIYRIMAPLLILAAILFSLMSSVARDRSGDFLWCMAALLTAACPLSSAICYGLPWRKAALRLSKLGAALAGWPGVTSTTGGANLLLTDIDLFPVGAVSLNGIKIFGDLSVERVISLTSSVIRDSGSALEKIFRDLLRSQGGIYRRGELFTAYEGGGASEVFGQDLVQVGSASFMVLMGVALPPGLKVKNAVFCAINGDLAGIFALNYHLPAAVLPSLEVLIRNKITPVLCTRDFNLIPSVLRQRFKLPVEKMEFPPVERRRELSDPDQDHSATLTALLSREGLGPYAEAVTASRRLRSATRLSAVLACLGGVVGLLLAFYLAFVGAYASLTPANLLVFLVMWSIPAPLIAGWVDRY